MAKEQLSGYIVLTGVAEEEDGLFVLIAGNWEPPVAATRQSKRWRIWGRR